MDVSRFNTEPSGFSSEEFSRAVAGTTATAAAKIRGEIKRGEFISPILVIITITITPLRLVPPRVATTFATTTTAPAAAAAAARPTGTVCGEHRHCLWRSHSRYVRHYCCWRYAILYCTLGPWAKILLKNREFI